MNEPMIPAGALQPLEDLIRSVMSEYGLRESPVTMPTKLRFVAHKEGAEHERFEIHTSGFPIKENPGVQSSLTTWSQLKEFLKQSREAGASCYVSILQGMYTIACFRTDTFELQRNAPPVGEGIELVLNAVTTDIDGRKVMVSLFEDKKKSPEDRTIYVGCLVER